MDTVWNRRLVAYTPQIIRQTLDHRRGFRRLGWCNILGDQDRLLGLDDNTSIGLGYNQRRGGGIHLGSTRRLLSIDVFRIALESNELLSSQTDPVCLCC